MVQELEYQGNNHFVVLYSNVEVASLDNHDLS